MWNWFCLGKSVAPAFFGLRILALPQGNLLHLTDYLGLYPSSASSQKYTALHSTGPFIGALHQPTGPLLGSLHHPFGPFLGALHHSTGPFLGALHRPAGPLLGALHHPAGPFFGTVHHSTGPRPGAWVCHR